MLFKKDIEPCCSYCLSGTRISDTEVVCFHRGIVSSGSQCKKFRYDPLKRRPISMAPLKTSQFSEEDFIL